MATYYTQLVVNPTIPAAAITKLEKFLLDNILGGCDEADGQCYFYAEDNPNTQVPLDAKAIDEFMHPLSDDSAICPDLCTAIREKWDGSQYIDLDDVFGGWEPALGVILQGIVRRNNDAIPYFTVEMAFTCSRMRPDGFGGGVGLITAKDIEWFGTNPWLQEAIAQKQRDGLLPPDPEPTRDGASA